MANEHVSLPWWRWVVLLAGWLSFALVSGTLYTSGLFYVIYLEEWGASRSTTAWVGSLCSSVYLMYGPGVAWALATQGQPLSSSSPPDCPGCRPVIMFAGVVACLAHILNG